MYESSVFRIAELHIERPCVCLSFGVSKIKQNLASIVDMYGINHLYNYLNMVNTISL